MPHDNDKSISSSAPRRQSNGSGGAPSRAVNSRKSAGNGKSAGNDKSAGNGKKAKSGGGAWKWLVPVLVLALAAGGFLLYQQNLARKEREALLAKETFYPGVFVDGIALGDLTRQQAFDAIEAGHESIRKSIVLTLVHENEKIPYTAEQFGVSFDTEQVIEQAMRVGREGAEEERLLAIAQLLETPVTFETSYTLDDEAALAAIASIAGRFYSAPQDAQVLAFTPENEAEKFTYQGDVPGEEVDAEELDERVLAAVRAGEFDKTVQVPMREVAAAVTLEDVKHDTQLIGTYTTIASATPNRNHNIMLASGKLVNVVVQPGEEFSINGATGQRTAAQGYREAPILVGGNRYEDGFGGGVCQVSTTLYNALLLTDVKITRRSPHSIPASYVGLSFDAAISYGSLDLKFINTREVPLYITSRFVAHEARDGRMKLTFEVYGPPLPDGKFVELRSVLRETIPAPKDVVYVEKSDIAPGTPPKLEVKARDGYRSEIQKRYYTLDQEGKRQYVSDWEPANDFYQDHYRAIGAQYYVPVGENPLTKPTPSPSPVPTPTPETTPVDTSTSTETSPET